MARAVVQFTVQDASGNVVPNASITIRNAATDVLVQIYSQREGGSAIGNPATADSDGFFRGYIDPARVHITASLGSFSLTWQDFVALDDVDGAKGDAGDDGWSPVLSVVPDGDRRVLQVTSWDGGSGDAPDAPVYVGAAGFTSNISDAIDIRGPQGLTGGEGPKGDDGDQGDKGDQGDPGNDGWSPVFAVVSDGARRVLQVSDWIGGQGTKPNAPVYVAADGFKTDIGEAIDIRGPEGSGGGGSVEVVGTENEIDVTQDGNEFTISLPDEIDLAGKTLTTAEIRGAPAVLYLHNTAAGADQKRYRVTVLPNGNFQIATMTDANEFGAEAIRVQRSGNSVELVRIIGPVEIVGGVLTVPDVVVAGGSVDQRLIALEEVEEFTPTLTFDTPGDLSVTYARQYGRRVRLGRVVYWEMSLAATPSYTTASGAMLIVADLPQPEVNNLLSRPAIASAVFHGNTTTYPSGRNTVVACITGADQVTLFGVGDGVSAQALNTAHVASGVSHVFDLSGMYIAVEA